MNFSWIANFYDNICYKTTKMWQNNFLTKDLFLWKSAIICDEMTFLWRNDIFVTKWHFCDKMTLSWQNGIFVTIWHFVTKWRFNDKIINCGKVTIFWQNNYFCDHFKYLTCETKKVQSPNAEATAALVFKGAAGSATKVNNTDLRSFMTSSLPIWMQSKTASLAAAICSAFLPFFNARSVN